MYRKVLKFSYLSDKVVSSHEVTDDENTDLDNDDFQCKICQKTLDTERGLKIHMHVHKKKRGRYSLFLRKFHLRAGRGVTKSFEKILSQFD